MLTLQQILESDSISTLIVKLNTNFQAVSLSGGGPQGIPGEQGIPGLPGRQGPLGPTGAQGPTGTVVGIIPFGSTAGGSTGPTGIAGPWNTYSYEYLTQVVGTGASHVGEIWIDHWNKGFWQYLIAPNGTSTYTNSPYSNPVAGTVPPGGTGYFGGTGWYFYPLNEDQANASDVWVNDITTYQTAPPYATGPHSNSNPAVSPSPLTVKNARLLSKYGTVWISSSNTIDGAGADDQSNLQTGTIYDQGFNSPATMPQPAKYNIGIDRLYFKQSIDTLPYVSNVTARSWVLSGALDPAEESNTYPEQNSTVMDDWNYWVKPLYSPSINQYSPIQYYSERRDDTSNYPNDTIFGSLGLYQYSTIPVYDTVYTKSLFVYSTRTAITPDVNVLANTINPSNTFNIGEMLIDVKKLIASNQFICSTPQDLYGSSDNISGSYFDESAGDVPYTVTQGFLGSINSKKLTGNPNTELGLLDFGNLTDTPGTGTSGTGNFTRSIWYGSAAMVGPDAWRDQYDSEDAAVSSSTIPNYVDKTYRIAGMKERGKKTWFPSDDTHFLSELIFYSSQFEINSAEHAANSSSIGLDTNNHNSRPGFYLSPSRNFGIGTFAFDDSGVLEPAARLHVNTFIRANDYAGMTATLNPNLINVAGNYVNMPANTWRAGAFTAESSYFGSTATSVDLYIGGSKTVSNEEANPASTLAATYTPSQNNLDVAIRRETWSPATNYFSTLLRLGVKSKTTSTSNTSAVGIDATLIPNEFSLSLVPLVGATGATAGLNGTPVGVGIHNIFPRARGHFFGKNLLNEAYAGNQPYSPGFSVLAGQSPTGTYPHYTPSLKSSNQVIIDYLGDSYTYPAGVNEYPYDSRLLTGADTNPDAVGGISPNAANFPSRDKVAPTRSATPWGLTGRNYSYPSTTGAVNGAYRHGATGGDGSNFFSARQYIGFNLFRDLLNTGDNADSARWRLGSNGSGYGNGGAAIVSSEGGDLAFVNIPQGRDGGFVYNEWEQQGLSTRDVLNNISLLISKKGDLGLGNRPGYDPDAYSSQERNLVTGEVNYVPSYTAYTGATGYPILNYPTTTGDARTSSPATGGNWYDPTAVGGTAIQRNWPYGLLNYSGLSATYVENTGTSSAAAINANATSGEYIRFEIGAEKFYGKNSRSSLKAGYGYPPNLTKTITAGITGYLILDPTYTGVINNMQIITDFEGRIDTIRFSRNTGAFVGLTGGNTKALILPHPTEFNQGSGTPWATAGFTAPPGAVAGELLSNVNEWDTSSPSATATLISDASFESDEIGTANLRLNNFVAGEGMNASSVAGQAAAAAAVKAARQASPKLILSFLEADNTYIPGTLSTDDQNQIGIARNGAGDEYRKVNTVIASKQNEASVREYWIPKTDNTGGTFMVFTDHYGNKTDSLDETTVETSRFYVEEVVTLEIAQLYSGIGTGGFFITDIASGASGSNGFQYETPMYIKYFNSRVDYPYFGLTGVGGGGYFSPSQYGQVIRPVYPAGITGTNPISYQTFEASGGSTALNFDGSTTDYPGAAVLRNVDKYYSVWSDNTNWDNGWNTTGIGGPAINNKSSAFRFKRINQDMALIDFNMTIEVTNPNLDTGVDGPYPTDEVITTTAVIDRYAPRWTQYVRLAYLPTKDFSDDNDYFMRRFGNALSFANYSSFNQWYPGTAIVSYADPNEIVTGNGGDSLSKTGGPQFNFVLGSTSITRNVTWNGNFIDAVVGSFYNQPGSGTIGNQLDGYSAQTFPQADSPGIFPTDQFNLSDIVPRFGFAFMNAAISSLLFHNSSAGVAFRTFSGRAYSILGNDWLSRQRSCMWRVVPRYGSYYGTGNTPIVPPPPVDIKNNSFTLEIMFDKPILHISTPFKAFNFQDEPVPVGSPPITDYEPVYPYKYLTLNGQAMVRYSNQTQTPFEPTI